MGEFRMPMLGADMEAGTLVEWLKQPGELLKRGDIIAVVDTEKGAIEIEVFEDGLLEKTLVNPGEKVPVGTVLALIRGAGEPPPAPEPTSRAAVSPAARKLAAALGVDLERVQGTGQRGAITREDVERAAAAAVPSVTAPPIEAPPAAARAVVHPTIPSPTAAPIRSAVRAAIAAAMARSKREIPHYYLATTIDMSAATLWLRRENERRPMADRLLAIALFVKTVALALHDVPELNGYWVNGAFRQGAGVHVGCAIALRGGGLVAPAVHDADQKDLGTLMRQISDLVARARTGSLKSSELTDPTITVTNLGERGVEAAFGIIYPPQVALVGFGRIADRPWVAGGQVGVRPLVTATLAADHRASDGHRGGVFLAAVDRRLQTPEAL